MTKTHEELLDISNTIGDLQGCADWFSRRVAALVDASGKSPQDLTVGELVDIIEAARRDGLTDP